MDDADPDISEQPSGEEPAGPDQQSGDGIRPRRRRWPLGLLTIIAVVVVGVGVVLLRNDGPSGDATTTIPSLDGNPDTTGDVAPDFALNLLDGTSFRLSAHLAEDGRPVFLNLWASWCGPCRAEMPALDQASKDHPEIYFLGVAVEDDPVAAENFANEIGVSYDLAIDEAERVSRRYPSFGLPATFLIAKDGTLRSSIYGQLDESRLEQLLSDAFGNDAE